MSWSRDGSVASYRIGSGFLAGTPGFESSTWNAATAADSAAPILAMSSSSAALVGGAGIRPRGDGYRDAVAYAARYSIARNAGLIAGSRRGPCPPCPGARAGYLLEPLRISGLLGSPFSGLLAEIRRVAIASLIQEACAIEVLAGDLQHARDDISAHSRARADPAARRLRLATRSRSK